MKCLGTGQIDFVDSPLNNELLKIKILRCDLNIAGSNRNAQTKDLSFPVFVIIPPPPLIGGLEHLFGFRHFIVILLFGPYEE
jgi:hypothetical protein